MIIAIRISGMINMSKDMQETLFRFRLRRKYAAVLVKPSPLNIKLLKKLRNHIAYGDINKETLKELVEKRALPLDKLKKINVEKVIEQLEKNNRSTEIKPFFRLHPPRGGIESKKHFGVGKGVLADNKDKINDLVRRML